MSHPGSVRAAWEAGGAAGGMEEPCKVLDGTEKMEA